MTTPSGLIKVSNLASELGIALPLSLKDSRVLTLAGVGAVPIALSQCRNKGANLSLVATNGYNSFSSVSAGGTATCSPSVSVSNGTAPYSFSWAFTSNPSSTTLSNANTANPLVSKTYAKQATGSATAVLQCTVTDSGGKSATVYNVNATIEWSGTA